MDDEEELVGDEELLEKRKMELLEDQLARLTSGAAGGSATIDVRPTADDVRRLKARLVSLSQNLGLAPAL